MKRNIIIFDLDGTLLNTLDDLADSTNYALQTLGYPKRTVDEVRTFVGNGVAKLIERAIPVGVNNAEFEKCLEIFKEHYSQNMYNKTAPYDGIVEVLKVLKENGCKIAVVSNKFDSAVKELCEKYFLNLVDIAFGENEKYGIRKKPAPDTVLSVVKHFCANIDDCVYIGDSEVDIMTAQNSNMPCISVLWGFKDKDFLLAHSAQVIVETPDEIVKYLENGLA